MLVVGRCRRCGGWTMFTPANSKTARSWSARCEREGDEVALVPGDQQLGPACSQDDLKPSRRTCIPKPTTSDAASAAGAGTTDEPARSAP